MGFLDYVSLGLGLREKEPQRKVKQPVKIVRKAYKGQISLCEPNDFGDIVRLVNSLRKNLPLIVNFTHLRLDNMTRGLDFVCGAVCALNGNLERISEGIYFYAPPNLVVENLKNKR